MLESIYEAKLLQPVTAYMPSHVTFLRWPITKMHSLRTITIT